MDIISVKYWRNYKRNGRIFIENNNNLKHCNIIVVNLSPTIHNQQFESNSLGDTGHWYQSDFDRRDLRDSNIYVIKLPYTYRLR